MKSGKIVVLVLASACSVAIGCAFPLAPGA